MESQIGIIVNKIAAELKRNPKLEKTIELELNMHIRNAYAEIIKQNIGYCSVLKVPEIHVFGILDKFETITLNEIKNAFIIDWKLPHQKTTMWTDPYYYILLLIILYALRVRNQNLAKTSLTILLMKLWNGRKIKYIRYCEPETMKYVISNMSGKFLATKYDNPLVLIMQYLSPTLIDKYGPLLVNPIKTKDLFSQGWSRICQLFISDRRPDLETGKLIGHSGIAPLYFKAKQSGLKISKPTVYSDEEGGENAVDFYSSHEYDEMINTSLNYIIMNLHPKYEEDFINKVHEVTSVNVEPIKLILTSMHNNKYNDYIRDLIELMFRQLEIEGKSDICSPHFIFELTKKKIISSKHSKNINELKKIGDLLLTQIFRDYVPNVNYLSYSQPRQGHMRKVIFYGLSYNINRSICK